MADKDYSKINAYTRDFLTRKQVMAGVVLEYFDGTGGAGQVHYMSRHADAFMGVLQLCDSTGATELPPNMGRWLQQTATLTSKTRAYTYSLPNKSLTFGNGTNGYQPPDTSSDTFYAFAAVYIPKTGVYTASTVLTWTEQVIADNVAPDTDSDIYCDGAEDVSILFDTDGAVTGAPNFDLDIIASLDGAAYQDATNPLVTAFTAQDKGLDDITHINPGAARSIRARLDVNGANLAAGESVSATVKVTWRY
jgi:hypothetical protein